MRTIIAVAALAAAVPMQAHAADADMAEEDLARAAEQMRDPARQEQLSQVAEAVVGAMMDVPVGQLLQAAATIAGEDPDAVDPDATVADLAGPEAAEAPREFAHAMPRMMDAMGVLTEALGRMLPELRRAGADIARKLPENLSE